jgi:hypothetical protein
MRISISTPDLSSIARFLGHTNSSPWCGREKRTLFVIGICLDAVYEGEGDGDTYFATVTISEMRGKGHPLWAPAIDFTEIEALEHLGVTS